MELLLILGLVFVVLAIHSPRKCYQCGCKEFSTIGGEQFCLNCNAIQPK